LRKIKRQHKRRQKIKLDAAHQLGIRIFFSYGPGLAFQGFGFNLQGYALKVVFSRPKLFVNLG
jgi:hypothetical protein